MRTPGNVKRAMRVATAMFALVLLVPGCEVDESLRYTLEVRVPNEAANVSLSVDGIALDSRRDGGDRAFELERTFSSQAEAMTPFRLEVWNEAGLLQVHERTYYPCPACAGEIVSHIDEQICLFANGDPRYLCGGLSCWADDGTVCDGGSDHF